MAEKISLTELQLMIKDSLYISLPDFYWVAAEISEIKENYSGHCYLELIDKNNDDENVKSRVKAVIWSSRYRFLRSLFENVAGESLQAGMKILVKVRIEYHELYGLSLVISDIDPAFTIGEMAVKRQLIIKRLEEEGVFSMNKELEFPRLPQRIAIISSKNAAGYTDFIRHLKENNKGYIFYTALFETVMQGGESEQSVLASLNRIADNQELFDLVAIIRGGGSQSDLSWFDNYNIAYYITQFPIPVITGIGHEKDLSVTDMVAFQALKTPTAVADHILECVEEAESSLNEIALTISRKIQSVITDYFQLTESFKLRLLPLARMQISDQKGKLSGMIIGVINFEKEFILKAGLYPVNLRSRLISSAGSYSKFRKSMLEQGSQDLRNLTLNKIEKLKTLSDRLDNTLNILNPENVLKRGYTITSVNGMIIKSADRVQNNDCIDTRFSDGSIRSVVVQRNKDQI